MTQREKLIAALTKLGEKQVPTRSGKYLTFTNKGGGFWFVGSNGALRSGRTSSQSYAVLPQTKVRMLKIGEAKPITATKEQIKVCPLCQQPPGQCHPACTETWFSETIRE